MPIQFTIFTLHTNSEKFFLYDYKEKSHRYDCNISGDFKILFRQDKISWNIDKLLIKKLSID